MNSHQFSNSVTINYYNKNAPSYFEQTVNLDMSSIYPAFLNYIPKVGHILDAGCGSGRDTKYFLDSGYRVTAIDASEAMVELSSTYTGQASSLIPFQELRFREEFHGIWACASLLHIPKSDIATVFKRFIEALKVNGIWYMSFKVGSGEEFKDGRFFNCYTEDSLLQVLNDFTMLNAVTRWHTCDTDNRLDKWLNLIVRRIR